jgi:hypothetical protein
MSEPMPRAIIAHRWPQVLLPIQGRAIDTMPSCKLIARGSEPAEPTSDAFEAVQGSPHHREDLVRRVR